MFDRLEDLLIRYEEVMGELQEPGVADDPVRFRKLMKEQSDLAPIVETVWRCLRKSLTKR